MPKLRANPIRSGGHISLGRAGRTAELKWLGVFVAMATAIVLESVPVSRTTSDTAAGVSTTAIATTAAPSTAIGQMPDTPLDLVKPVADTNGAPGPALFRGKTTDIRIPFCPRTSSLRS